MSRTVTNASEHDAEVRRLVRQYPTAMGNVIGRLGPVPSPGPGTSVAQMQEMIDTLTAICELGAA